MRVSASVHRFTGQPQQLALGARMFTFAGYDVLRTAIT
jgi:hypothetical protein